jgi:hypothetical protein
VPVGRHLRLEAGTELTYRARPGVIRLSQNLRPRVKKPSTWSGRVDVDGQSEVMTVTLKDVDNRDLWSVDIEPRPDARPGQVLAQHI